MEGKVKFDNFYQLTCGFIASPPSLFHRKEKHFSDNGNTLTGQVKHKLMRFVKYLLRTSCFMVLKSWQILWKIPAKDFISLVVLQAGNMKLYKTELHHRCL